MAQASRGLCTAACTTSSRVFQGAGSIAPRQGQNRHAGQVAGVLHQRANAVGPIGSPQQLTHTEPGTLTMC